MRDAPALLGRQDTLEQCLAALATTGGVLVTGAPGIGKSALLDAVASASAAAGQLVLRSASAPAESWLPYLGLYDLFSEAVATEPDVIPFHLRSAFDAVLLRSAPVDGAATDQLAIRVAVVEALRGLSANRPVLLVLDDVDCLDAATAEVLSFAVRRRSGGGVRVLAAERLAEGQDPTCWLLPDGAVEIALGALPSAMVGELLRTRLGLPPTDQLSQRIRDAAGGNPFYSLELGRAALRSGTLVQPDDPLPVPDRLRALLADRLSALPKAATEALLLIATAARPPRDLLAGHEWGLSRALASGIIVTGRDLEPRFSHPLLREIVYADADLEQRQACHARLARLHDDPLERARHHALATSECTEELADELEAAARIAVHRGAPGTAAALYRLAAERTPGGEAEALTQAGAAARDVLAGEVLRGGVRRGEVISRELAGFAGESLSGATADRAADAVADARYGASGATTGVDSGVVSGAGSAGAADGGSAGDFAGEAANGSGVFAGAMAAAGSAGAVDPADLATAPDPTLGTRFAAATRVPEVLGVGGAIAGAADPAAGPVTPESRAVQRLLESARAAFDAGLPGQARAAAEAVMGGSDAAARVGARLLLVELEDDLAAQGALLDAAEADARDHPGLRARVCLHRAEHAFRSGAVAVMLEQLERAEEHARQTGDVDLRVESIVMRVPLEIQVSPEQAIVSLEQAEALTGIRDATLPSIMVRKALIVWFLRRGDVLEALATATRLRADVERAGRMRDLGDVLHLVASVHERAGLCRPAYDAAVLGSRMRAETGSAQVAALLLGAAAELLGGTAEKAAEVADAAVAAGLAVGETEFTGLAHGFRGRAEILLDRPAQAAHHLARCRAMLHSLNLVDPSTFLVDADLAESLARCGSFTAADRILDEAAESAVRLDRDVVLLGLTRARMLRHGLAVDAREAADRLRAAIPAQHSYPLEIARAQVTLGELERRARRRAAARTAWESAAEAYGNAGNLPWHRFVQSRLARLDSPTEMLSTTERQIVDLVRAGATNRQIAATLHVSVKAVEGNLTRLFRRFGVSSRSELAGTGRGSGG